MLLWTVRLSILYFDSLPTSQLTMGPQSHTDTHHGLCFLADRKSFCTIHSTGYLKSWPPTKMGLDEDNEPDNEGCNLSCLVAIGRLHSHMVPQPVNGEIRVKSMEYVSRHAIDGKFVFVDQR